MTTKALIQVSRFKYHEINLEVQSNDLYQNIATKVQINSGNITFPILSYGGGTAQGNGIAVWNFNDGIILTSPTRPVSQFNNHPNRLIIIGIIVNGQ